MRHPALRLYTVLSLLCAALGAGASEALSFEACVANLGARAAAEGIQEPIWREAVAVTTPVPRVLNWIGASRNLPPPSAATSASG